MPELMCTHRAAGEVDGAPLEHQAGVGEDFVELGLRRRLGGRIGGCRQRFAGRVDRVGAGPSTRPCGRSGSTRGHPQRDEQRHRREFHALGEGAHDQRRGDRRERHLEADVDELVDGHADREGCGLRVGGHAFEEDLVEAADEGEPPVKARL
jgi:hypothetical protein